MNILQLHVRQQAVYRAACDPSCDSSYVAFARESNCLCCNTCSHIMAARGSGEHALRHLLAPFARARHPLEGRLQARGSYSFQASVW